MREPNRPGSSGPPNPNNQQPPTYPSPAASSVRPSFTVVAPHIPHGQTLPPPTVARASQPTAHNYYQQSSHVSPQHHQIENLLHILSEANQRVDLKLKYLKEFFDNYDELTSSPAYSTNAKSLLAVLIRLMNETNVHFIAENETNQLRKLSLEVFLRMSAQNEHIRTYAKDIQKLLLNVILHDNEENALLCLKLLPEHVRTSRIPFSPEITNFFAQIRMAYRNFVEATVDNPDFFTIQPNRISGSIDEEVQQSLQTLYFTKTIHLEHRGGGGNLFDYTLLPRAMLSIRVYTELPNFLHILNQFHRQHVYEEVIETLPVLVRFVCVQVERGSNLNMPMVDDFHTAQIKALNFLAFIAKNSQTRQQSYPQRSLVILEENSDQLTMAINQLLESLNPHATTSRRDFMLAIKFLFESDIKHRFVGIVPKLTSDRYLLGEKFMSQDQLRYFLHHHLADLLYKIRTHLSYPMLLHAFKICIRCIHDSQLLPNYQMMYLKLMRSLCEPTVEHEARLNEPAREVLILALESLVKKLQIIADYYLPALVIQLDRPLKKDPTQQFPASPQKEPVASSLPTEPKSEKKDQDGADTKQQSTDPTTQLVQFQDQQTVISPSDCRNMVRFIFLPVQEIATRLSKCHLTGTTTSMYAERELFEQFFVQSIRCLEVFKIVSAAAAAQSSQLSAQLKSSLAKDEKETVDVFATIFHESDPKMFRYIFSRQINFFIDSFIANPSVQLVCKLFLLSDKTFTTTGSILMKHMLKHMSELGSSSGNSSSSSLLLTSTTDSQPANDKTQVYLRLFREIFHIVSGLNNDQQQQIQQQRLSAADRQARSKKHEAMLIPYLHQIVSDSIQLALRSRDPQHYFALLHALFRSIGTGSHDQLYQQFLPLLPSILQQLNRFQNGSYRQPIHDLYVELCLTVPVRLSSLLPYLPLLMDPLVCALHGPSKLVMQGLRTLELFVNNLQLDYVYDQMLPVRAALMQGIWRALYTQEIHYAMLALKILGKLGGSSRRAFLDSQNFTYVDLESISQSNHSSIGPRSLYAASHETYGREPPKLCIQTQLQLTHKPDTGSASQLTDPGPQKRKLEDGQEELAPKRRQLSGELNGEEKSEEELTTLTKQPKLEVSVQLPMAQIVESALGMIRSAMVTEPSPPLHVNWANWQAGSAIPTATNTSSSKMPKQQAAEICKTIVLQAVEGSPLLKMHSEERLKPIFKQAMQKYLENKGNIPQINKPFQCKDTKARAVVGSALTGLFYAAVSPELRPQSLSTYRAIVSHLTLQSLLESMAGNMDNLELNGDLEVESQKTKNLDGSLLIDVICQTLSDSCKHFCQAGIVALRFINVLVKSLFDTNEELNQAYQLSFFTELLKRINQLSYRRDWYAKLGGCTALRFFIDNFTREFVLKNSKLFLNAFFMTIFGLTDEVSYGAVDVASKSLDQFMDVCFDSQEEFDSRPLRELLPLICQNLSNAEPQLRNEANRLLNRLQELTKKDKKELLGMEKDKLQKFLFDGFIQFSSMSIGSQLGFLDFITNHLSDLEINQFSSNYIQLSQNFVSNLMTIIENTDIALHSMPSSRYSITNLPGSPHSLEDQMQILRQQCLETLSQHCRVLLSLKEDFDSKMTEEEKKLERLGLALHALDVERLRGGTEDASQQEKQLERTRWIVKYAYELAELPLPTEFEISEQKIEEIKKSLIQLSKNLKLTIKNVEDTGRELLIQKLEVIVRFLLELTTHPVHPMKSECRDLLKLILDSEPRFKLHVHAEIDRQLSQWQPIAMLNGQVKNPTQFLDGLSAEDRLNFLPHAVPILQHNVTNLDESEGSGMESQQMDIEDPNQPESLICVDLSDPLIVDALLEGSLSVQIEDQEGKVIAVGETIAFARVPGKSKNLHEKLSALNLTKHSKGLQEFGNIEVQSTETSQSEQEPMSIDPKISIKPTKPLKREIFVATGRQDDKFQFSRYRGPMPPQKSGTFVTITTYPTGQQIRSIRNYSTSLISEELEAEEICRQVEERVEEAAEVQRRQELLLSGGIEPGPSGQQRSYSLAFSDDSDKAHLQLANFLMMEAQSLGLDQPSSYTVTVRQAGNPQQQHLAPPPQSKRRTSSGVSAPDFQELMNMSDTDLREIGEEIIQNLPDFRSPEKQQDYSHQQAPTEEPYMDPVQEVVASMRAAAVAQKQVQDASANQQQSQYSQQNQYQQQMSQYNYGQNQSYQQMPTTSSPMPNQHQQPQTIGHIPSSTSQPMPYLQQQFVQPPTSSPMQVSRDPKSKESQRYEQENGLDAEYTLGQQASTTSIVSDPQTTQAYPFENSQSNLDQSQQNEQNVEDQSSDPQKQESMETESQKTQNQESIKDNDLDEYLLVQTEEAWQPPVVVHVPVLANGRAEFSKAHIASDRQITSAPSNEQSATENEDKFVGQLDDEPLLQQSRQPFNPILIGQNGKTVEMEAIEGISNSGQNEDLHAENGMNEAQVEKLLSQTEEELKSKQDEDSSDRGSEDSFEYITMDKDESPFLDAKKLEKRAQLEQNLDQTLKDLTKKHKKSDCSESSQKSSPSVVIKVPGLQGKQVQELEIAPDALELMKELSEKPKKKRKPEMEEKHFVLKVNDGNLNEETYENESVDEDSDNEQIPEGPYSHVTNKKLRLLFTNIHEKSPEKAEEAIDYYVERMTELLQNKNYLPKVDTEDSGVRMEYAHESIRLPTGHIILTLPRVHFNYLSEEVFEELKAFDQIEDAMQKEVDALAEQLQTQPKISDKNLEQLFEYQSVNSQKLSTLSELTNLVDARIPPRLLSYLSGEISQLFKLDTSGEINEETLLQLKFAFQLFSSPKQERPLDFLKNSLSFMAELNENLDIQEQIDDLLGPLTICLDLEASEIIKHILQRQFLEVLACRRLIQIIFKRKEAKNLRSELLRNLNLVRELLNFDGQIGNNDIDGQVGKKDQEMKEEKDGEPNQPLTNNVDNIGDRIQVQIDCCLLRLLQIVYEESEGEFKSNIDSVTLVHKFWRSPQMENRYSARRPMVEEIIEPNNSTVEPPVLFDSMIVGEKFEVPEICVRLIIGHLREHQDRIDLLYDCCSAFHHEFVTDFTFLTKYIEDEIVPVVPLEWRHEAFQRLIEFFRPRNDSYPTKDCILLAKFTQQIIIPCFQQAFNTQPIDDVVRSKPFPEDQTNSSIIWQFCRNIIEPYYHEGSSPALPQQLPVTEMLKITLYQFCSLLVQRCPDHIHFPLSRQRQPGGNRGRDADKCLRFFMLFGWHCLQSQYQVDLMERHAGQFLIVNLMDKFAISKQIIHQAINGLLAAHQQDLRDIVRKSLEIIIPVVASRGDGSDLQLFQMIKKVMDETHQHSQTIHCISILTRHFKVFFRLRLQIADLLMSSIHRLYNSQLNLETKKLILEVCETILKWENQRNELLEKAQSQDPTLDRVVQQPPLPSVEVENINLLFERPIIDQMLQFLIRITTSTDQAAVSQAYPGSDPYSLVRRALVILRRAIKPQLFGHIPLRTTHLERQLSLPQARLPHEEIPQEQQNVMYNLITQTLDIILALVSYLASENIPDFMHNLQRPISACISCSNMSVAQSCFKLIGKLAEQSAANQSSGLANFEILNTEIQRYLNDSMNYVASNGFSQCLTPVHSMQLISRCLALLRVICKFHPTYLETTCFVSFLKMFQRLVLEYNPAILPAAGTQGATDPRQKIPQDLCSCMDLLKGRLHALNSEARRAIDKELQALVDKPIFNRLKDSNQQTPIRRVAEKLVDILVEMVRLDLGCTQPAPMGLKLLVHVYERMHPYMPLPADIMSKFLAAVQLVFEDKALRKTDLAEKLHTPFFLGLAYQEQNVWFQFFRLFETQFPAQLFERLIHIISEQNWLPLNNKFWIPHCIHLLLRSATSNTTSLQFKNCATFTQTAKNLTQQLQLKFDEEVESTPTEIDSNLAADAPEPMQIDNKPVPQAANATENSLDSNSQLSASDELFVSGKTLLDMISTSITTNSLTDFSRQLTEMSQVDHRLASSIFVELFSSIWNQLKDRENGNSRANAFEFFLQSGQLATRPRELPLTPLQCFYLASQKCSMPSIRVDESLLESIGVQHFGWFNVVEELELRCRRLEDNSSIVMREKRNYTNELKQLDSLTALYKQLGEDDLIAALWKKRSCLKGTFRSITLFNQGMFKEARLQARQSMNEGRDLMFEDAIIGPQRTQQPIIEPITQQTQSTNEAEGTIDSTVKEEQMEVDSEKRDETPANLPQESKNQESGANQETSAISTQNEETSNQNQLETQSEPHKDYIDIRTLDLEMRALESTWIQCCRELNDWSTLTRYANCNDIANAELLGEAAWHKSEWALARELVPQIEAQGASRSQFASSFLQTMSQVAGGDFVQRQKLDELSAHLIGDWRQLPSIMTPAHMQIVRMAQRVQEVAEANQVNKVALEKIVRYPSGAHLPMATPSKQFPALMTHRYAIDPEFVSTIKQTVKTWRNRPLTIIDPASHWSDTFTWRVQQYWGIMRMFENADSPGAAQQSQVMHPLHSISQAQINYARTLRKTELYDEASHELSMFHAMSQVHPIDAGMALHEQVKCLVGVAERVKRQRKYGEKCLVGQKLMEVPYLNNQSKEPEVLIGKAIELLDSARLDVLSNDQLARLLAVKASLHSQYNIEPQKSEDLFAASARLIESTTVGQPANAPNTMAASQLVWKYWSLHWERRYQAEFKQIWSNGEFNANVCLRAHQLSLETLTTLLECMRTATDQNRGKKFAARFFHFLRSARALELLLNENNGKIDESIEDKKLTIEEVLNKHAGAVSAVNWLFWLEQIIHEIRSNSSKEMTKILCTVADAYPQQVLVSLRSVLWPELITQRIEFIQQRLPLISDWIRCAPPLDVTGINIGNEPNESENQSTADPYAKFASIQTLERHEEQFADSFTLWRSRERDRQLLAARRRLLKFLKAYKELKESGTKIQEEARVKFDKVRQNLEFRYLRLKHMQKFGILPRAPLKIPRCLNMTLPDENDFELNDERIEEMEEEVQNLDSNIFEGRIQIPNQENPFRILVDASQLEQDGYELFVDIQEDRDSTRELPEFQVEKIGKTQQLQSWAELLLQSVDAMCVGRYADVRALNTILNELDQLEVPWLQLAHSELIRIAEFVYDETFKHLQNPTENQSSSQIQSLMQLFSKNLLEIDDPMDGSKNRDSDLRQSILSELETLKSRNWPLLELAKLLCKWLERMESELESVDELVPLRDLSPYLSTFNSKLAHLDMCHGWSGMRSQFATQISQFLPMCRRLYRQNGVVLMFAVLSQNGKVHTYQLRRHPYSTDRNRSLQLFHLMNNELLNNREVCRRSAQFALPDIVHTGQNYQIMECNPMSGAPTYQLAQNAEHYGSNLRTLDEIGASCIKNWSSDSQNMSKSLWRILHDSFNGLPPSNLNNRLLADWMRNTYPDPATHWMVRKKFSTQWALYSAMELGCGLSSMNLKEMHLDLASAQLFSTGYKFSLQFDEGKGEFKINDSPLFRLTPNLAEYMQIDIRKGVELSGHLTGTFIAATRALASRSYVSFLRTIFWDLCENGMPQNINNSQKIEKTIKAAQELPDQLSERLKSLAIFTSSNFKALELLENAASPELWQKINPAQHPWF